MPVHLQPSIHARPSMPVHPCPSIHTRLGTHTCPLPVPQLAAVLYGEEGAVAFLRLKRGQWRADRAAAMCQMLYRRKGLYRRLFQRQYNKEEAAARLVQYYYRCDCACAPGLWMHPTDECAPWMHAPLAHACTPRVNGHLGASRGCAPCPRRRGWHGDPSTELRALRALRERQEQARARECGPRAGAPRAAGGRA